MRIISKNFPKNVDFFVCSDIHIDSPKFQEELFIKHCKEIVEKEGHIVINGDLFDLMQGRYDPRRNKQDLNPRFSTVNYLDSVIEYGIELLKPFSKNI